MANVVTNAAGRAVFLGTQDLSGVAYAPQKPPIPQHLTLFYLFAQRGNGRIIVDNNNREQIFGPKTFDPNYDYFNHQTLFCSRDNAASQVIERVVPPDAGPMSNIIVYLDVLETDVDTYQRNADGSITLDEFGVPTITGTTPGVKVKFVVSHRTTDLAQGDFGAATIIAGDQTDPVTSATSQRYPIFEVQNSWKGKDGNNTAIRIYPLTKLGGKLMPQEMMDTYNAYPYYFSLLEREDETSSPKLITSIYNENQVMFTFVKKTKDPISGKNLAYDRVIIPSYNRAEDQTNAAVYGRINKLHVYDNNIDTLLTLFHDLEIPFIYDKSDFTSDTATRHLFNFITGVDSNGRPYDSYVFTDASNAVRFSNSSTLYLAGGSDGTMTNEVFESLVQDALDRYNDPNDKVQDLGYNREKWFYDSGFSLDTKLKIPYFIKYRPNTCIVLGTHTVGQNALSEVEEYSVATSLLTRVQLMVESETFGTPATRGMIMGFSGTTYNNDYLERVPVTYEILDKFSRYQGSATGNWINGLSPEGGSVAGNEGGNIIRNMKEINITHVSDDNKDLYWGVSLNWVLRNDTSSYFIPHYKSVYDDDTSVLNSIMAGSVIAELNNIAYDCWKFYCGRTDLTGDQLADLCDTFITERSADAFNNQVVVVPETTITEIDAIRGFSWTLPIKFYMNNMKTHMTTYIQSFRMSSLTA